MSPKKRYGFWIEEEQLAGLRLVKDRDGVLESEQIRRAIKMWLESKGVLPPGQSALRRTLPSARRQKR